MDEQRVVVVEIGSSRTRVGLCGEDLPTAAFPTSLCYAEQEAMAVDGEDNNDDSKRVLIGDDALTGGDNIRWPVEGSVVHDWDDIEALWGHIYARKLNLISEDHPVMITDSAFHSRASRERWAHMMFEVFNVPSLYMAAQPLMSLYAAGVTSGVVIESGHTETVVAPVHEGNVLHHAMVRLPISGSSVTSYLAELLQENRGSEASFAFLNSPSRDYVCRQLKESISFVALDYEEAITTPNYVCPVVDIEKQKSPNPQPIVMAEVLGTKRTSNSPPEPAGKKRKFSLPSGTTIEIDRERYQSAEILFQPRMASDTNSFVGIVDAVLYAVEECDADIRKDLLESVILSGGNTLFPGIAERIHRELFSKVSMANLGSEPSVIATEERRDSSWAGAAIVGALPAFSSVSYNKEEYDEHGPAGIHRKCFA